MIKHDMRQAFLNIYFPIAVVAAFAFLFYGDYEDIIYGGADGILGILQYSSTLSYVPYILPVVAALPYAGCYYEEIHSGYYYFSQFRCNRKKYAMGKTVTALISGMTVTMIACVLFLVAAGLVNCYGFRIGGYEMFYGSGNLLSFFHSGHNWIVLLCKVLLLCMCSGFWALVSLLSVAVMKNQYVALAMPFFLNVLIKYCVEYIGLQGIHPYYHSLALSSVTEQFPLGGIPVNIGYFLVAYVILFFVFYYSVEKK